MQQRQQSPQYGSLLNMQEMDVPLFDRLVCDFYQRGGDSQLNEILCQFAQHPRAWQHSSDIILKSNSAQSKLIALKVLQHCIQTRWKILPEEEKKGMRNFITNVIIETCKNSKPNDQSTKLLLTKMNTTLIEVAKYEWPHNWPDFIPSIIDSAKVSETVCMNVVRLLEIFSEEVFGPNITLTQVEQQRLRDNLYQTGNTIFVFFLQILKHSKNVVLLQQTLKALNSYIRFLPPELIFNSDMIEILTLRFLPTLFQVQALECMCEIVTLPCLQQNLYKTVQSSNEGYRKKLYEMFEAVVSRVRGLIPENKKVPEALKAAGPQAETFIRLFSTLVTAYLKTNLRFIEASYSGPQPTVVTALQLMLESTGVKDEEEILRVLTGFWEWWSKTQVDLVQPQQTQNFFMRASPVVQKSTHFEHIKVALADSMVINMVRPKEVLITRDDMDNVIESEIKMCIRLEIYQNMSQTLQRLCKIDLQTALQSISKILQGHFGDLPNRFPDMRNNNSFRDWALLDSVCWSIGTISGSVPENDSKDFLVKAIQALLYLCERTPEKKDKAVVAANIMYVVRKNPRFLQRYWKLLQTVIGKLFEFMQERFQGVQEMACETFEEIARRCRQAFSSDKQPEATAFLNKLLTDLPKVVNYLPQKLIQKLWKGFGWIIKAEKNDDNSAHLLVKVMLVPNQVWVACIARFNENISNALNDVPLCSRYTNILRTNCSLCETLKQKFSPQLGKVLQEMMIVYETASHALKEYGNAQGPQSMRHDICLVWRNIIRSTLELLTMSVETQCLKHFETIQGALEVVLLWFPKVPPLARDPQVYVFCTAVMKSQGQRLEPILGKLLDTLDQPTRQMIQGNDNFPDHRKNYFLFLKEIVNQCFPSLIKLQKNRIESLVGDIVDSMKHPDNQMAEIGLQAMLVLLQRIKSSSIANQFYATFLGSILTETFIIITDTMHSGGFPMQVQVLRQLIEIIDDGSVTTRLWSDGNYNSNRDFVKQSIMQLVARNFPRLQQETIFEFTDRLFKTCLQQDQFVNLLKDFIILTRQIQK